MHQLVNKKLIIFFIFVAVCSGCTYDVLPCDIHVPNSSALLLLFLVFQCSLHISQKTSVNADLLLVVTQYSLNCMSDINTLRTGLLNCLNARSQGLIQSEVMFL